MHVNTEDYSFTEINSTNIIKTVLMKLTLEISF